MKGFEKAMDAATEDFLKAPLDPWKAEICTVSLSAAPNEARVIFINNPGENQFKTAAFVTTEGRRNLVFDVLDQYLFRSRKITKIAVNLAFETKQTAKLGKYILSPVADPLIMWVRCMQIMAPEKIPNPKFPASGKGLKPMTKEVFGVEMTPFEQVLEERGVNFFAEISADDPAAVEYSAEDSDYAVQHYLYWREIAKQIPKYDKWLHEIEMPFTRVIGAMEFGGMRWDDDLADQRLQEAVIRQEEALRAIERVGAAYDLNIKLNKTAGVNAVKDLLFNKMGVPIAKRSEKGGISLDAEALVDMRFMLENKLLEIDEEDYLDVDETYSASKQAKKAEILAREENPNKEKALLVLDNMLIAQKMSTLAGTHIEGRRAYLNLVSGRIHAGYSQWTETGRLNSSKPNGQNTPRPDNDSLGVRSFFLPAEGKVMFLIDFSGFELRLMAWRSGDETMTKEFKYGSGDLHRITAATITGKDPKDVTKAERSNAKAPNFLISYGGTEHALRLDLKLKYNKRETLENCKKLIDAVYLTYPRIKEFQREATVEARECGYSETIYGYKRLLPYINSTNRFERGNDERRAANTPIQGSAADIMKRCQNEVYELLGTNEEYSKRAMLIAQIHDEQIFELDDDPEFVQRFVADVKALMEQPPMPDFPLPIEAEASIAYRWNKKMSLEDYLEKRNEK